MKDDDLTHLLNHWPHQPGRINARIITGADGTEQIQVRIDLGILQFDIDGRPDGARPQGFQSLLAFQLDRIQRYTDQSGTHAGFIISVDECKALREEAVQYYHRYVALFALGDFHRVIRDCGQNLQLFDLCRDFAAEEHDRVILEQFRPHVLMMRTRAEAELALAAHEPRNALSAIDAGMREIQSYLLELGGEEAVEHSNELQLLRGMRDALVPKLPASQRVELEERLQAAIDAENYELAAILRDELRLMGKRGGSSQ